MVEVCGSIPHGPTNSLLHLAILLLISVNLVWAALACIAAY